MTLLTINISSVVFAIVMTVTALLLYRLTRSGGVLVLLIACLYLSVVRITIAGAETFWPDATVLAYRSHLIAPFWPAMALAFLLLLRSLRSIYTHTDRRQKNGADYEGPERRKS